METKLRCDFIFIVKHLLDICSKNKADVWETAQHDYAFSMTFYMPAIWSTCAPFLKKS